MVQIDDAAGILNSICHGCFKQELDDLEKKLKEIKDKEIFLINSKSLNLMEYQKGIINKSLFLINKRKFTESKKILYIQKADLKKRRNNLNKVHTILLMLSKELFIHRRSISDKKIADYKVITKEMLAAFIDKIYLYRNNRLEIKLRYQNLLDQCFILMEELKEDGTI